MPVNLSFPGQSKQGLTDDQHWRLNTLFFWFSSHCRISAATPCFPFSPDFPKWINLNKLQDALWIALFGVLKKGVLYCDHPLVPSFLASVFPSFCRMPSLPPRSPLLLAMDYEYLHSDNCVLFFPPNAGYSDVTLAFVLGIFSLTGNRDLAWAVECLSPGASAVWVCTVPLSSFSGSSTHSCEWWFQ